MMKSKLKGLLSIVILILLVAVAFFLVTQWSSISKKKSYTYEVANLPKQFNGFVIAHVSNPGNSGSRVMSAVKKSSPDIIVVTGDIGSKGASFINNLGSVAPTFYVLGVTDSIDITSSITNATYVGDSGNIINITDGIDAKQYISDTYGDRILELAESGDNEAQAYVVYIGEKLQEDAEKNLRVLGLSNYTEAAGVDNSLNETMSVSSEAVNILLGSQPRWYTTAYNYDINMMFTSQDSTDTTVEKYEPVYEQMGTTMVVGDSGDVRVVTLSDGTIKEKTPLEKFLNLFIKDVGTIYDNDGGFKVEEYQDDEYEHLYIGM